MTRLYSSISRIKNHLSINSEYIKQPAKFDSIIEYTDQHVNFGDIRAKINPEDKNKFADLVNCLVVVSEFSSTSIDLDANIQYFVALEKHDHYTIDKDRLLTFLMKFSNQFTEDDVKVILEACTGGRKANIYPALDITLNKSLLTKIKSFLFDKGYLPDDIDKDILNVISHLSNVSKDIEGNFIFPAREAVVFIDSISADSEFDKSQSVAPIKSIEVQKPLKGSNEERLLSQSLDKFHLAHPRFQVTTEEKNGKYIISFKFIFSVEDAVEFIDSISADTELKWVLSIEVQKPVEDSDEEILLSQALMRFCLAQPNFQITTEEKKGTYIISFKASSNSLTIFKPSLICIKHSLKLLNENLIDPKCQIEQLDLKGIDFNKAQTNSLLEAIYKNVSLWVILPITTKFTGQSVEARNEIFTECAAYEKEVKNRTFRKDFEIRTLFAVRGDKNQFHFVIIEFKPKQLDTGNSFFESFNDLFE